MDYPFISKQKIYFLVLVILFVVTLASISLFKNRGVKVSSDNTKSVSDNVAVKDESASFVMPISDASSRITKKHFGTYVTPKNSPVSPEVFTGFHTAVDFETFPSEKDIDVPIYVICSGKILVKRVANGYGGMVVQSCALQGSPITVVYGHLRLADMKAIVGDTLKSGEFLTNLGTGYSTETAGERKHLHLGIHKGATPDTRGYIANKSDLQNWIDFEPYVK
ncbi:MAG: M23 family metallopeptidase [Patescibacteria group bacterium]